MTNHNYKVNVTIDHEPTGVYLRAHIDGKQVMRANISNFPQAKREKVQGMLARAIHKTLEVK